MSKSTLYTFNLSVWSAAADLARIELGLVDKIYAKQVDVLQGESVAPWFLKINPAGTVPVVVADGKLYGDTTLTIEYMASISSVKIAPRTDLTAIVHNDAHDPNLMLRSARNEGDIARKAGWKGPLTTRVAKIKEYAALPESAPYKDLFDRRIATFQTMLDIFSGTASDEQKRVFFAKSQANYEAGKTFVLETLPAAIGEGPFVAGATPGEDDFHIAAWLFRASRSGGGTKGSDGIAAFEDWFGAPVPEAVKALWNAWIVRESWKEVYPDDTLH